MVQHPVVEPTEELVFPEFPADAAENPPELLQALIDTLKAIKSGEINLDNALNGAAT